MKILDYFKKIVMPVGDYKIRMRHRTNSYITYRFEKPICFYKCGKDRWSPRESFKYSYNGVSFTEARNLNHLDSLAFCDLFISNQLPWRPTKNLKQPSILAVFFPSFINQLPWKPC